MGRERNSGKSKMARGKKSRVSKGVRKKPQATLDTHVVRQTRRSMGALLNGTEDTSSQDQDMSEAEEGEFINLSNSMDSLEVNESLRTESKESESKKEEEDNMQASQGEASQLSQEDGSTETHKVGEQDNRTKDKTTKNPVQNTTVSIPWQVKRVNPSSRNRRVCNRILGQDRDTTPERQNTRTYQHVFKTRVTVKLTLSNVGDMHQSIRDSLKSLLAALTKADATATIMPWLSRSNCKELH